MKHKKIHRPDNALEGLPARLQNTEDFLANTRQQLEEAKAAVTKPFLYEAELASKSARLAELNAMLNMDKPENEIVDSDRGKEDPLPVPAHTKVR